MNVVGKIATRSKPDFIKIVNVCRYNNLTKRPGNGNCSMNNVLYHMILSVTTHFLLSHNVFVHKEPVTQKRFSDSKYRQYY
ncbi:CLUMA_CG005610, isoform A [Clunio marinus]|uniref:CLUMA_CG005610, isoform A n=1 Tax=Clunio marinus TaxID=568069 RepID=A0A1J1HZR7_9DIPT|nr:CLUMA_CG005610, isoform A [Clunio marinus]